eukprot:SAG31_NODE_370_length_16651_cov_3.511056_4_plen_90_part_00
MQIYHRYLVIMDTLRSRASSSTGCITTISSAIVNSFYFVLFYFIYFFQLGKVGSYASSGIVSQLAVFASDGSDLVPCDHLFGTYRKVTV